MKPTTPPPHPLRLAFLAVLFALVAFAARPVATQEPATPEDPSLDDSTSNELTPEHIESLSKQVEASTKLDDELKTGTLDTLKQALSHLEKTLEEHALASAFKKDIERAPAASRKILETLKSLGRVEDTPRMDVKQGEKVKDLDVRLASEKARRVTKAKKLEEFDTQLKNISSREEEARAAQETARAELEDISTALEVDPIETEDALVTTARRMELETRRTLRSTELERIGQELLSLPMRTELLEARRAAQADRLARLDVTIKSFGELVGVEHDKEAQATEAEADRVQLEAARKHPFLMAFAEKNSELGAENTKIVREHERAKRADQRKDDELKLLVEDSDHTTGQLKEAGVSAIGGSFLRDERKRISRVLRDNQDVRNKWHPRLPKVSTRRFEINLAKRKLTNLDDAISESFARDDAPPAEERLTIRPELSELLVARLDLYETLGTNYEEFVKTLRTLEATQKNLDTKAREYARELDEWLLWVASAPPVNSSFFTKLVSSFEWLFSGENWSAAINEFALGVQKDPIVCALMALALIGLLLGRGRFRREIEASADLVGKPHDDHFGLTLRALLATVLFVAPLPLVLACGSWFLAQTDDDISPFVAAMGAGLLSASIVSFIMGAFRTLSLPRGVGAIHLRWREQTVSLMRHNITWARPLMVFSTFIMVMTAHQSDRDIQGSLGLLFFVVAMLTQFVFLQRILRPRGGIAEYVMKRNPDSWLARLRYVWYPLAIGLPLAFAIAAILGYTYTAFELERRVIMSSRVVVSVILLNYLAVRWLVVAERRLAIERAREQREAKEQAAEAATQAPEDAVETEKGAVEVPEVDISTINDQSKKLLRTLLSVVLLLGLWGVWAPVFPALQILDSGRLWPIESAVTAADGTTRVTIIDHFTLQDLALAIITVVLTMAAARNLPGVLEIVVLKNLPLEPSIRYAITTVAQYALTLLGIIFTFHLMGIGWSKVQWLVAALSVGVGFGLQEIVANFICGLILLFERPIRVGDIVSVGDVMGTVSRIRIRATTITNWDRMDYIVPNKELITGRLLNWTLTNTINRIVITVGAAYGSDTDKARRLLVRAAEKHPLIMTDPAPIATFQGFGDSCLDLVLRCYLPDFANRLETTHELHTQIKKSFEDEGIEIAFPQLDLHLRSGELKSEK
jgi:potassium efflux system protein